MTMINQTETIVLASRNKGKIREINQILKSVLPGIEIKGLDEFPEIGDIPETGSTFEENALIKARMVFENTGYAAIADDSGLVVPALGGAPGVYSARYSGEKATDQQNNDKLLSEMRHLQGAERRAAFVCVMAAISSDGRELLVRGEWPGVIAYEPAGDEGFGYDPLFFDPEAQLCSAQMNPEQKNIRSHRGKALAGLAAKWKDFISGKLACCP
ncbi:MAG: RdgB/HAM1 family non-canonical purine NTP pyrophosphatase [Desulfonatronovibrio sp.]